MKLDKTLEEYLDSQYEIQAGHTMVEVCIYLGDFYKDKIKRAQREWENLLKAKGRSALYHGPCGL